MNQLEKELRRYSIADKIVLSGNIIVAILLIVFSQRLLETNFGKYTITLALVVLALISCLRILKKWGPKDY
ncbi:hypothetical protein CO038_02335 [Candidatus Pacearchaeota archaeon CG_4_9_14_0_2_um_filter_39_13]|nr:hypothetical protein [Candidatus Pacearchaeota archaeon]OIO43932.1 MAG: hypothetical protein AUJ64_01385 [Candidatus Pacearchaeota archaeon CG1_02_39_14]PJC44783.1 MAG: hypothetical protein CO038_02335 [Candidatus Pacearchaeota archaeon CG_4_9_14_0_2_um_filter_39_13]